MQETINNDNGTNNSEKTYNTRAKTKDQVKTTQNNLTEVDEVKYVKNKVLESQAKGESNKVEKVVVKTKEVNEKILRTVDNSGEGIKETVVTSSSNIMAQEQLNELIKLLTLKISNEEVAKDKINISVENFAKIIPEFNGNNMPVEEWFNTFESNAVVYELTEKQKYVQTRNKVSGTAKLFLETINVSGYSELKTQLINEFGKTYNCSEIHRMLSSKCKLENETFHEYMLQMRKIAALGDLDEASVIRYIVDGLKIKVEMKYQLYTAKTFKELRDKYEIYENMKYDYNYQRKDKQFKESRVKKERCFNCGSTEHKRSECKTQSKCFSCNKFGHIAKDCFSNKEVKGVEKNINFVIDKTRYKKIKLNNEEVECLIDTGSDVSLITENVVKGKFKNCSLKNNKYSLCGLGNQKTTTIGCLGGTVTVDGLKTEHEFLIVPHNAVKCDAILGFDFTSKFKFCSDENGFSFEDKDTNQNSNELSVYNISAEEIDADYKHKEQIEELIKAFTPITPSEKCPIVMKITPNSEMKPFRHSPSRLPIHQEQVLNDTVTEWLRKEIIRESHSDMASRVILVKKKCGDYRVCVDYRQLNKMVLKDSFPVPIVDDVLLKLQRSKFFIVMDLENGFFHVPIDERSRKYTAFITKRGLYEFNKAPFGFCNSPAYFIRYVSYILQHLINTDVLELYIDDIVIYGETAEECIEKLKIVLNTAAKFNLRFKWSKCSFIKNKIEFLGYTVEGGAISPGTAKAKAVKKFATPRDVKGIQSFLGLTGYFRKFVKDYASIAKPLTDLLKKNVSFQMSTRELMAIEQLKTVITSEPILKIYNRNAETELHTDASKEGFGATLFQIYNDKLHPVFYWSKKASPQESRLHSYILEVKAVYLSIKKFRHYLLGIEFKLVTDCSAFKQTVAKTDIPRDVAQWVMCLQEFTFTVEHRPGSRMKQVDCLSRYPNVMIITSEITTRIKNMQQTDEYIKSISLLLQSQHYEDYKTKGGLVFKTVNGNDLLVVPKRMEVEIIKNSHEEGHFAVAKTMHAIQQQFYIPHLEEKVSQIVRNCVRCIMHNKKLGKKEGMLQCINKNDVPLNTLHIDHVGPMDATCKQYKYILTMVDAFSKFVWLFVTKTTNVDEVVRNLTVWSNTFGNPNVIISDRGAAFTSMNFKEYCEQNAIEHVLTTTGVPRGNGQVERVNRCILSIIAKLSHEDPSKWYKYVGQVQKAINSRMHNSTRTSPFEILFGTKIKTKPEDRIREILEEELIGQFDKDRQELRNDAKKQILKAQEVYKKQYDKNRKEYIKYAIGNLVAIKRTQFIAGKKLANEYMGPYKIIKIKRNDRYQVTKSGEFEGPNTTSTSSDFMKPWRNDDGEEIMSSEADDYQDGRM